MGSEQQTAGYVLALMPALIGVVFALGTKWSPKGTLFGVTVGPAFAASPVARRALRRYRSANLGLALLFSLIGLLLSWRVGASAERLLLLLLFIQFGAGLGTWLQGWQSILQAAKGLPEVQEARKADEGWKLGGMIYANPKDPAVFVPKRFGWGLTVNFARPTAWLLLFLPFVIGLVLSLR